MTRSRARSLAALLLALAILIQLIPSVFAADKFSTSGDPLNFVDFSVDGSVLTVKGRIRYDGLTYLWTRCGGSQKIIAASDGASFSVQLELSALDTPTAVEVLVTDGAKSGSYRGYIWSSAFLTGSNGNYHFVQSPVLPNNRSERSKWINPAECLALTDAKAADRAKIRAASDEIVGTETDNYAKVRLLYQWVAENIYYDYDYLNYLKDDVYWMPAEVLEARYSVCEGYARLLVDLIRAQGIPAIPVINYAHGDAFDTTSAKINEPNHMYAEAFVDGRWISMDPTWDSGNEYSNGTFIAGPATSQFFDITDEALAWTHKIINYYGSLERDIPTQWAREEVMGALIADLVPDMYQADYRRTCNRTDVCRMVVRMVCRIKGADSVQELADSMGVKLTGKVFPDTSDPAVELAYYLGLVQGTGNGLFTPNREITRQEAATLLSRAANLLKLTPTGSPLKFGDQSEIAAWAADSICFLSALTTPSGQQIVAGIGGGLFSPMGNFTREQSIIAVYRLYEVAAGK